MQCPACTNATLAMTERQGVEVDYCPQCRGVWLDRGELDKLIERAAMIPGEPGDRHADYRHADRRHEDDRYGDHGRSKRRRLSRGICSIWTNAFWRPAQDFENEPGLGQIASAVKDSLTHVPSVG